MTWQARAACNGWPTHLFFLEVGENIAPDIKALCAGCPVKESCLDLAMRTCSQGVWAGTTEKTRRRIKRRRVA